MEKEFVFKNKEFRKRCTTVMRIAAILAGVYMLISLINIPHCQNYPRLTVRMVLTAFYTLELCLFAHRNSIYMEIGGDYALARRAGAGMMISLIVNSIVEGYYVSAFLEIGTMRGIYMCLIVVIGCLTTLPLILYQYLNFDYMLMRFASFVSVAASVVSFCIGFLVIATNQVGAFDEGILSGIGAIFDSFAPLYLIHCLVPAVVVEIAKDAFNKQMKLEAKFAPESRDEPLKGIIDEKGGKKPEEGKSADDNKEQTKG